MATPFIPENIRVKLGAPNSDAEVITVPFPEYIKNVASSEIYPNWPDSSIRANIYAQISYALNRIYTEYYPSRGYNFDITNSTAYDQYFIKGRNIFGNISEIVDDIFNDYLVRPGSVEPLFAQYCNGTTVTCEGLSQWGTVTLANEGYTPYEILTNYYGDDLNIVFDAPIKANISTYPGMVLQEGVSSNDVRTIQTRLNRISTNYPAIPKIYPVNGLFGKSTEDAVKKFQEIFDLTVDGLVGKATWYKISYIYSGVKRLSELNSEGLTISEIQKQFSDILREGSTGNEVLVLQYYLNVIATYFPEVSSTTIDGSFGENTRNSVISYQNRFNLPADGIVGRQTWNSIYSTYRSIVLNEKTDANNIGAYLYPGRVLSKGSTGEDVTRLQTYLNYIAEVYTEIDTFPITGYYGDKTENAVRSWQTLAGLEPNGVVGPITWNSIALEYINLRRGFEKSSGQFPGYTLSQEA